jgi:hypothetical protein
MNEEQKRGLLRVGADFFGGPVDLVYQILRNLQVPEGKTRDLLASHGLATEKPPALPVEDPKVLGSSEWIAAKTGLQGDSPEYRGARLAGNIGLMALPWAVDTVRNFNPRHGDLNMWIGPRAKDYDHPDAYHLAEAYERFMRRRERKSALGLTGEDVDAFNKLAFDKHKAIVEPASKKVLQFRPDTVQTADPHHFMKMNDLDQRKLLKDLYPDPNLDQYPGLKMTMVERTDAPNYRGSFSPDPTLPGGPYPHRQGTMELNTGDALTTAEAAGNVGLEKLKAATNLAGRTLRHEIGHSIQASEGLPQGGNSELLRRLGEQQLRRQELLDEQRSWGAAPLPATVTDSLKELALAKAAERAVNDPYAAYEALVGERLSRSAEVHHLKPVPTQEVGVLPFDPVREQGVPRFANSLVIDQGELVPISQYVRGLRPTFIGSASGYSPSMAADLGSVRLQSPTAQGLLSPDLARLLQRTPLP